MSPRLSLLACLLPFAACGDDVGRPESETLGSGGSTGTPQTSGDSTTGTPTPSTTGSSTDPGQTTGSSSSSGGGEESESSGGACADALPPQLLSMRPVVFSPGTDSVGVDLEFDQEVTIAAGGLTVDGGATISAPVLPATGSTFTVTVDDLVGPGPFTLSIDAASVTACDLPLEMDASLELSVDCDGAAPPVSTSVAFQQLAPGTDTDTYEVTFDLPVTLQAGAISIASGPAVIDSITPPLPATSDTFTVELSSLGALNTLAIDAADVVGICGGQAEADVELWVCTTTTVPFDHTGAPETFTVPACAEGSVSIVAHGAAGGSAVGGGAGGLGAEASGSLDVTTGELLEIRVGGQDGFNGGAAAGPGGAVSSGSGGGASDVRLGGNGLEQRVIVAGGGGGGAAPPQGTCAGGAGGPGGAGGGATGLVGGEGTGCGAISTGGGGGTQLSGGTGGTGGNNCTEAPAPGSPGASGTGGPGSAGIDCNDSGFTGGGGGGGGGGYFGGGGGAGGPGGGGGSWGGAGGGGGSSYVDGLGAAATLDNVQSGDGDVSISW